MKTKSSIPVAALVILAASCLFVSSAFAENQPPVVNAGGDRNAYTGALFTLYGSAVDPDGDPIVFWTWEVIQTPTNGRYRLVGQDTQNLQFLGYVQGDYVVSLTAGDGTPTGFGVDYATVHVADNLPPTAVATADPTTITVGGEVCFDGSQSSDPEGGPLSYLWVFRDGSLSSDQMTVCHAFQSAGTYAVGLQVTDEMGANDQDAVSITVNPPANHPPVANPTATPNTGDAPLMVVFAANASDPDNDPLGYLWDFGDPASGSENTSTLANPSHIYDQAGTYNVWLTVSDGKTSPAPSYLLTVTVEPEITLSVRLAIILYLNKQKTMGSVTLWADLDTDKPATDDVVTVWMDGVRLFSLPFGAFKKGILPGAYVYIGNGLLVRLDLANHRMLVMTPKMDVSRIDNSNGVDVEVMVGNAMVVEKIRLTAAQMNTLIYRRKGVQGDPQ